MKKTFQIFCLTFFFFIFQTTSTTAQEWSFGGELGATIFSFFDYTQPVHQEGGSYDRGYTIPHNEGWILGYYPTNKKYFFTVGYTRFHPRISDVIAENNLEKIRNSRASATFNHTISLNMGNQVDVGSYLSLKSERLFFEPIYGVGIELLRNYTPSSFNLLLLPPGDRNYKTGINPSLQTGFRLSYRHRRSKFSIKALGNLGLRYHVETEQPVILPEEPILAIIRSKSDFLAAQVSYEYIFKSDKIEKKKRKKESKLTRTFNREKIEELKIGIHPTDFDTYFSLNYELFPVKQKKSLFLDLTLYNFKWGLSYNISEDENNPNYIFSRFREPFLDIRLGQHLFSDAENAEKWGIGYYLRSEFRLLRNQKFVQAFERKFGQQPDNGFAFYAAIGASLQYKWLFKNRWSIAPMVLCDLGIANGDNRYDKHVVIFDPIYFDVQARLYIGYRF